MVLSYSAIAQPTADTPIVISLASTTLVPARQEQAQSAPSSPSSSTQALDEPSQPIAGPSNPTQGQKQLIQHLILDAGPLLSLTPLRHLATTFHTTPSVLAELRDPKAREHWERLSLAGVDVRVEPPSAESMAKVIAFAKKTGDFAVLSQTDLSVIALTYQYEAQVNGEEGIRTEPGQKKGKQVEKARQVSADETTQASESSRNDQEEEEEASAGPAVHGVPEITQSIEQVLLISEKQQSIGPITAGTADTTPSNEQQAAPSMEAQDTVPPATTQDEESESDGGEWINPANLKAHRSRDLGLSTPDGSSKASAPDVACMTGDYAVQNVLLGMGLGLVGEGGKRISKVKSWVLRCHACFKICKDSSKRFCPSCGNATLLRTSITTNAKTGEQTIHLKKNFQYHLRGTKYSIPDPKMGRAKGQVKGGSGLILREDQREWSDAVRQQDMQRQKAERKVAKGALEGWNDPDWLPEIITVGMSGKGRSHSGGMPSIGHGRKNPNQARRKK